MESKKFKIIIVLSVLPYYALFIIPAIATLKVVSQYGFFSPFSIYFLSVLCLLGAVFPLIPLSVAFHTGIIINFMLKKLKVPKSATKILSVILAIIIFILLTVFLVKYFSQMDSL